MGNQLSSSGEFVTVENLSVYSKTNSMVGRKKCKKKSCFPFKGCTFKIFRLFTPKKAVFVLIQGFWTLEWQNSQRYTKMTYQLKQRLSRNYDWPKGLFVIGSIMFFRWILVKWKSLCNWLACIFSLDTCICFELRLVLWIVTGLSCFASLILLIVNGCAWIKEFAFWTTTDIDKALPWLFLEISRRTAVPASKR